MAQAADLSITNYQFVSEERVTRTSWYVTYRADIINNGPAQAGITATVRSLVPSVTVVAGQGTLHFPPLTAGGRATSVNTFTLLVDRTVPFDFANLVWSFLNPVANPGVDQTTTVGSTVFLSGGGSTNPGGVGTLTYSWVFKSLPAASHAVLSNPSSVTPSFVADVPGTYVVTLTVSNGTGSDAASVTISTVNSPPVAKPGANQTVALRSTVTLNGSSSFDVDGDPLTYLWGIITRPAGSNAEIANARMVTTTFLVDKPGTYIIQLTVNDGKLNSIPATVTIDTANTAPVAFAGADQHVNVNSLVQLNGAGSSDVDGDALTFRWSLMTMPEGSTAVLSSATAVNPTFTADRPGTYVAQLIVNDGKVDSAASTATITTNALQAPISNAGSNQTVRHGEIVTLSGSGHDPQSLPLTLAWSLITRPPGSTATLSRTDIPHPTFTADKPGSYVAQLVVGNGFLNSLPATVTITTTNTTPVADAGTNQNVTVGSLVSLNGGISSDADQDPLTYSWSFTSRPLSSTVELSGAATKTPTFLADAEGTYVVQLIVNDGFTNSVPATVTITASNMRITLTPDPLNLTNAPVVLNVALSAPAGPGGLLVTLNGFDHNVISLPSSVLVPENSTGANVIVTPVAPGSTNLLVTAPGFRPSTVAVTVTRPKITLTTSLTAVGLTRSITGTITLSAPAVSPGTVVSLSASPSGIVTFDPSSVSIAAGGITGTFRIVGAAEGTTTITASASGYLNGTADMLVAKLGGIILPTNVAVTLGSTVPLNVALAMPAPVDGATISLSSSDPSILTVSQSTFIAQGATAPDTPPTITGKTLGSVTITASSPGFVGDTQTVKVSATLSFSSQAVTAGAGGVKSINLLLSAPAPPGGLNINLTSSNTSVATVPNSVQIPADSTSVPVQVTAVASGTATITASTTAPNVASATTVVTVTAYGSINLPSNVTVGVGKTAAFPVALSVAAPQDVTVTLSTNAPGVADISPKTLTIMSGQMQPASQPQLTGVGLGTAAISASAPGFGTASQQIQTTASLSLSPTDIMIEVGASKDVTLTLSAAAPSGGLTVNITASPAGIVTGPSSVTIPQGGTTATVTVTGASPGAATITAAAAVPNIANATASVTVNPSVDIVIPATVKMSPGDSVIFPVTLSKPAQSSTGIELSSNDQTKVAVSPTYIVIAAGQTQSSTTVHLQAQAAGTATITARSSMGNLSSSTSAVTVGYTLTASPTDITIVGNGNQALLTLTLSSPAPAGGIDFSLSSSNTGVATVPSYVPMSAGTRSLSVRIISAGAGTAVIHVSAPGVPEATANVTVLPPGAISMSLPASIDLNKAYNVTLSLGTPAPPGGVTVELVSSDPSKVSVSSSSVFIQGGATTSTTTPQIVGVNVGSASISATASGFTSPPAATVQVHASVSWITQNVTIVGIGSQTMLTLRLSTTAPMDGLVVNLRSSNPEVATIQPTGTFIWDGSNAPGIIIPVNSVALGSTVIHASGVNVPDVTTTVTVTGPLAITTTSLPYGNLGALYSGPLAAGGGTTPYTWSASGLPAGLSIDSATSQITGTPTASGTFPVTVTVTDSSNPTQTNSKVLQLTVGAALTITTSSLPAGLTGAPYTATAAAAGGVSPYTWSASGLPAGFTMNSTTGQIIGSPSTAETANVTITVTDSANPTHHSVSKTLSLTIAAGLSISIASLPDGVAGTAYAASVTATGGTTPYAWSSTGLPAGLAINSTTGQITGNASAPFSGNVTITVTDSTNPTHQTTSKILPLSIVGQLTISTTALPNGVAGTAYAAAVSASGGTTPYTWAATGLPNGFSINSATGQITGSPAVVFAGNVTITVSDATNPTHQTASKTVVLSIVAQLAISTTALSDGIVGVSYTATPSATGGTIPYSWTATGLPAGLSMDTAGHITGTPTTTGPATVVVTATDSTTPAQTASKTFTMNIGAGLAITTSALPDGTVGSAYTVSLAVSGGTSPFTWSASGLPANLAINPSSGQITGTPSAAFSGNVTFTVTDSTSPTHLTASKTLPLTIAAQLAISTSALPDGISGVSYSATTSAAGGTAPYSWSASGLPAGLSMSATGQITGIPSAAFSGNVTLTVSDSSNPTHQTVSKTLALTVVNQLTISTTVLPDGIVGVSYTASASANGGVTPYSWSASGLPAGLNIDAAGHITGTPSSAGTASVTITVTDSASPTHQVVSKTVPLKIVASLSVTTTTLSDGVVGGAYSSTVSATGGTTPYSWTASGLPAGFSMSAGGQITGNPAAAFSGNVTITVTDSTNPTHLTASKTLPLTIREGLTITTGSLPNAVVGAAYTANIALAGGTSPYSWSATGLPANVSINASTGVITGTPTVAGTANVTISVSDSTTPTHQTVSKTLVLTVVPVLAIATSSLPEAVAGASYTATMAVNGGTTPYNWSATGLPATLTINAATGQITGTPAAAGTVNFTVTVTDSTTPTPQSTSKQLVLNIREVLSITTGSMPNGVAGSSYAGAVSATGGLTPYSWSATGLPATLSINATTGQITGTPTTAGSISFTATVTDSTSPAHQTVSKQLTIVIREALSISTVTLPDGVVQTGYSASLAVNGGASPFSWSATGMPAGFSINATTGQITGTPTTAGTFNFTVTVTDSTSPTHQSVTKGLALLVRDVLAISTTSLPGGIAGVAYSAPVTATGGATPFVWSATGLPTGFSIGASTGVIAGTLASPATINLTVTVTDSTNPNHQTATKNLTIAIGAALSIDTVSLPNGVAGKTYSATLAAAGGTAPYSWSASGLPAGISIDASTGIVSGTPSAAGTANVTVTLTDSTNPAHLTTSKTLALTVVPVLAISTTSLPDAIVGTSYAVSVAATGGATPLAWSATGLPSGFSMDAATGRISGDPATPGTSNVTVTATDSTSPTHQSVSKQLALTIRQPLSITTTAMDNAIVNTDYTATMAATGGATPYSWSATGLPATLLISAATGQITGRPTAVGTYTVKITVTDATSPVQTREKTFTLAVVPPPLVITTDTLADGAVGIAYSNPALAATGGTLPLTWSATGLPVGLTVDGSTGLIAGTPSTAGRYSVAVTVKDASAPMQSISRTLAMTIQPAPLVITTATLPNARVGTNYIQTVSAGGGTTPYSWSATGLPANLSINAGTGQISGTPTAAGTSNVTVTVTDAATPPLTKSKTFSLTIDPPALTITTTSLPGGVMGTPYSFQPVITGGVAPFTWTIDPLPRGLVYSSSTGLINGTPTGPGTVTVTMTVRDSTNPTPQTATKTLTLAIGIPTLTITTGSTLTSAIATKPYTQQLEATGGLTPYNWSALDLPAGLTIDPSSGLISGIATILGSYTPTITVTDNSFPTIQTVSRVFSLTVSAAPPQSKITVSSITVGENLQAPITITFDPPPVSDINLTISSANSGLVLLGTSGDGGAASLVAPISANTSSVSTFAKALSSLGGPVTITASALGYQSGTGTVTLAHSGFVVEGPSGVGASFQTYQGVSTQLTVRAARLDSSGIMAETQQIRGAFSTTVDFSSSLTGVGTVSPTAMTFGGGMDSSTVQFRASASGSGSTTLTVSALLPFVTPATGSTIVATVQPSGLVPFSATVGKNLEAVANASITGKAGTSGVPLTITSNDPGRLQFATSATGLSKTTITVTIPVNQSLTPDFWVRALDSSGTASYTLSSPAYGSVTSTVSLAPSGIVLYSPAGPNTNFSMPLGNINASLNLYTARFSAGSAVEIQTLQPDQSISVTVSSSNTAIGTITTSPVTIAGGTNFAYTEFHPVAVGTATITASTANYGTASVQGTITLYSLVIAGATIGQFLEEMGQIFLPHAAPVGGLDITLHSLSPLLKLSATATAAGSDTIILHVNPNGTNAIYYMQALGSSGTAKFTADASGYAQATASVDMLGSGVVVVGPNSSTAGGPTVQIEAITAPVDEFGAPIPPGQSLAGGASLNVTLRSSNRGVGSVTGATIAPGASFGYATFTPLVAGMTTISADQPAGWVGANTYVSFPMFVQ